MKRFWENTVNYISIPNHTNDIQSSIVSLWRLGKLEQALQILDSNPLSLDSSFYSSILQICIDSKSGKEGLLLHHHLLRNGFVSDIHLNTKFIIFYTKIGNVESARKVFDAMCDRNVVSWTAMISGFCQNGYSNQALHVFSDMHRSGVKANQFTYASVLKACTSETCLEKGKQIQGCIVKSRFSENLFVRSALVDFHSKCGRMEDARYIFEQMADRDVVCWNAVIGGYAVQGFAADSFAMFRRMLIEGILPDQFSIGSVLKGCGGCISHVRVNQIHGFVVRLGFQSYAVVNGSLVDAYTKCGSMRSARVLYDSMEEKDMISCTALITGYTREGYSSRDALGLFSEISQTHRAMDDVILCSMLNICANISSLNVGRQIHALAVKNKSNYDVAIGNALINMYAKSGEIEEANRAFDEMQEKNVISWTSLITGYGKHGYGEKAIALFDQMEDRGLKPNDVTFLSVLFACSHTGNTIEGEKRFSSMINEYNIEPRAEHYSCMVDLYARAGQLEQANEFICKMNMKPNASQWGAILGACRNHGSLSFGKVAAKHLFDLVPENSVNYVALASMYSAAGLWEEAWKTRELMDDKGMKKDPGCSYIIGTQERSLVF